ncbi:hypothetical protein HJG54_25445 [Leptolyngbya sp. NK1-12]|uniref:PTPA-CTERM sorting domain-containing protein n=1 Tax=Leptolyngbya sp. NK1-12 TaxID=2547451 RepID=A0AA97ART6_9CYAN|nr:hypothetical protein [Leptolyngbya sp. NK1-12]WNZ25848.1 hypothetical protein HJG54_25445 [Leptolyngbya sp. NK1-12]
MKLVLPTKRSIGTAIMAGFLLLAPAALISFTAIGPALAQVDNGDEDDNGVPNGGVAAGAGGAYEAGMGTTLPIAATVGGLVLTGVGVAAYRSRK